MLRAGLLLCIAVFLSGCTMGNDEMDRVMMLRADLLAASEVNFQAKITADYGDKMHVFTMDCAGDSQGDVQFAVTDPETISGITGIISEDTGRLTFDNKVLFFGLLVDDQLSPVSAPWIFLRTLRSGYIRSVGMEGDMTRITLDDSFDKDALQLDIWLDEEDVPIRGEILFDGRRILSLDIEKFHIR